MCKTKVLTIAVDHAEYVEQLHFCVSSLRQFHPALPVIVYTNLNERMTRCLRPLDVDIRPICVPRRFARHGLRAHGVPRPELDIVSLKVDLPARLDGDVLFLDADTEVCAPLDDLLSSDLPYLHDREYNLIDAEEAWMRRIVGDLPWEQLGLSPPAEPAMYNSGVLFLPSSMRTRCLRLVRRMMKAISYLEGQEANPHCEQLAYSLVLPALGDVLTCRKTIRHYWPEKYDLHVRWYPELNLEGE
ncbi:MAG: hypothetical protein KJZ69_15405 [Phycisphaerales bacterium]|nr:hypothetical protein [Phycisphaerales bacterium]